MITIILITDTVSHLFITLKSLLYSNKLDYPGTPWKQSPSHFTHLTFVTLFHNSQHTDGHMQSSQLHNKLKRHTNVH